MLGTSVKKLGLSQIFCNLKVYRLFYFKNQRVV